MKQILGILIIVFGFVGIVQAAEKLRLAISTVDVGYLSAGVADKQQFFKKEGLDVEVIRMNATISVAAVLNGDIDYTHGFWFGD